MTRDFRSHGADYTGHLIEHEMFGEVKLEEEERKKLMDNEFQPFSEAMAFVLEHQPFDPTDPEPRFANDLHATIAEKVVPDNYRRLRFFTAVGSKLDRFHSIDGIMEFQIDPDISNKVVRVSLDITKNPEKAEKGYKGNIIILVPDEGLDPIIDKEDYLALVERTATEIIEKFKIENPLDIKN